MPPSPVVAGPGQRFATRGALAVVSGVFALVACALVCMVCDSGMGAVDGQELPAPNGVRWLWSIDFKEHHG